MQAGSAYRLIITVLLASSASAMPIKVDGEVGELQAEASLAKVKSTYDHKVESTYDHTQRCDEACIDPGTFVMGIDGCRLSWEREYINCKGCYTYAQCCNDGKFDDSSRFCIYGSSPPPPPPPPPPSPPPPCIEGAEMTIKPNEQDTFSWQRKKVDRLEEKFTNKKCFGGNIHSGWYAIRGTFHYTCSECPETERDEPAPPDH